jgi:hypothetical protein
MNRTTPVRSRYLRPLLQHSSLIATLLKAPRAVGSLTILGSSVLLLPPVEIRSLRQLRQKMATTIPASSDLLRRASAVDGSGSRVGGRRQTLGGVVERTDRTIAGDAYATFIDAEESAEGQRKASLEQRGLSVISTCGVLVSLAFGFLIVRSGSDGFDLSAVSTVLLVAGLLGFVLAAILGLATNWPRNYLAMAPHDLRRMVSEDLWNKAEGPARRRLTENKVGKLETARKHNAAKAQLLKWAIAAETCAVALLAGGLIDLIIRNH